MKMAIFSNMTALADQDDATSPNWLTALGIIFLIITVYMS
jgi:hypothetical protein